MSDKLVFKRAAHWVDGKFAFEPEDYLVFEDDYTLGRIYKQGGAYAWTIYPTLMSGFAQTLEQAKEDLTASYLRGDHV
jgi:hypothetical protein